MPDPLILASTSRWRIELLARLDVPFECVAPNFDERAQDHRLPELGPHAFALELARGKAHSVADSGRSDAWILASDQLAVLDEPDGPQLLHKPGSEQRAVDQLMQLRGRTHRLISGVVLTRGAIEPSREGTGSGRGEAKIEPSREGTGSGRGEAKIEFHEIDEQHLTMRSFERAEAEAYVARHRPIHSAGSYHIEDAGIRLFERIDSRGGDHTGIMGLPLLAVCRLLRAAGLL